LSGVRRRLEWCGGVIEGVAQGGELVGEVGAWWCRVVRSPRVSRVSVMLVFMVRLGDDREVTRTRRGTMSATRACERLVAGGERCE
jgi:hypothetical protein